MSEDDGLLAAIDAAYPRPVDAPIDVIARNSTLRLGFFDGWIARRDYERRKAGK